MYPVYPLLCAIASLSAVFFIDLLDLLIKKLTRTKNINSKLWILATMIFVSLLLFIGRIAASYRNYHGK